MTKSVGGTTTTQATPQFPTSRPEVTVVTRGAHHGHVISCPRTRVAALLPSKGVPHEVLEKVAAEAGHAVRYVLYREACGETPEVSWPWVAVSPEGTLLLQGAPVQRTAGARPFTWHGEQRSGAPVVTSSVRLSLGGFHIAVGWRAGQVDYCVRGALFCSSVPDAGPETWCWCEEACGMAPGSLVYPAESSASDVFTMSFARSLAGAVSEAPPERAGLPEAFGAAEDRRTMLLDDLHLDGEEVSEEVTNEVFHWVDE